MKDMLWSACCRENRTVRKIKTVVDISEKTKHGGHAGTDMLWRTCCGGHAVEDCCRGHAVEDLL